MKRVMLGNKRARLEECPIPTANGRNVLVKVEVSPICGGDRRLFLGEEEVSGGHEGTGIVVDPGKSDLLKKGDRVLLNPMSGCGECEYCRSGRYMYCQNKGEMPPHFAQFVLMQDFLCTHLPDDISFEAGSLAGCTLAPAYQAIRRMSLTALDTLLVVGCGPVGLGAIAIATFFGARVIAVEPFSYRREFARKLGAYAVFDGSEPDIMQLICATAKRPLVRILDASGNSAAERLCIDIAGPDALIAFVGRNTGTIELSPTLDLQLKGATVFGVWHLYLQYMDELFEIIRRSENVRSLNSHIFGFSEIQHAFDIFTKGDTAKVLLKPWE